MFGWVDSVPEMNLTPVSKRLGHDHQTSANSSESLSACQLSSLDRTTERKESLLSGFTRP
jgi:hypothetical protein